MNDFVFTFISEDGHHGPKISSRTMVISSLQSVNTAAQPMRHYRSHHLSAHRRRTYARAFLFAFGDIAQHVIAMRKLTSGPKLVCGSKTSPARMPQRAPEFSAQMRLCISPERRAGAIGTHLTGAEEVCHHGDMAARSRSASSKTISGDLPPSSWSLLSGKRPPS